MQWMFNSEANCNKQSLLLQTVPIKQSKLVEMEIVWGSELTACSVSSALCLTAQVSLKLWVTNFQDSLLSYGSNF